MAVNGYAWLCMAKLIYFLSRTMYGYVGLCMAMYGRAMHGYLWQCRGMYGYVYGCVLLCRAK